MALTFRQVNCSVLALSLSQLIGLALQMSKYGSLRGCVMHIYSPTTQIALQDHGNSWKFPSTLIEVADGSGILFPCFRVLFRSKYDKINEYFYKGANYVNGAYNWPSPIGS